MCLRQLSHTSESFPPFSPPLAGAYFILVSGSLRSFTRNAAKYLRPLSVPDTEVLPGEHFRDAGVMQHGSRTNYRPVRYRNTPQHCARAEPATLLKAGNSLSSSASQVPLWTWTC